MNKLALEFYNNNNYFLPRKISSVETKCLLNTDKIINNIK